jgi:iron complex outermembrane recepter protein
MCASLETARIGTMKCFAPIAEKGGELLVTHALTRTRTLLLATCGVFGLTLGTPALAQQATPQSTEAGGLSEIIVTAQRREQNLQDAPLAVTAIGGDELAARGITSTVELGSSVPGLVLKPTTGTYSSAAFFIRGIGQKSVFNTFDPGVGLYVDDVYMGRTAFGIRTIFDIDRVEVLRGPQGTLYGRNSSGGAIKIVTRQPDPSDTEFRAEVGVGNYERYIGQAGLNIPLGEDLAFRTSGSVEVQDKGFVRLTTLGGTGNKADTYAWRGALRYNPGALDWTIAADWQKLDADGRYGSSLTDGVAPNAAGILTAARRYDRAELRASNSPIRAFNRGEEWGLSSNLSYEAGAVTLRSITAYRDFDVDLLLDANNGGLGFGVSQSGDQFSQELQASGGAGDDRFKWVAGLYYFQESTDQTVDLDIIPISLALLNVRSQVKTDAYAAYAQGTFSVTPEVRFTLGGRYSSEKKKVDVRALGFGNAPAYTTANLIAAGRPVERDDDKFTPKVGLEYDASDDVLLYASYSKGFKGGGFQATAGSVADFVPFNPENVDAYEIGIKSELLDRRLRLNVAAYWNDYKDIQLDTLLPSGSIVQLNVAGARVRGIEVEADAALTDSFRLFGFISYIDDEIRQVTPGAAALGVRVGGKLNDVPKWQWQLGANFDAPFLPGLSAQVSWAHLGEHFNTVTPPSPVQLIEASDSIDARLRYEPADQPFYFQIECENCFNHRQYIARLSFAPGYPAIANTPALVMLRAGVKF